MALVSGGAPGALQFGPGTLFIAPLGTTEPTDLTTALVAGWVSLGYTEEGSQFSYAVATSPVAVAEEYDPLRVLTTGRTLRVEFALSEVTATNLKRALNGGTLTTAAGVSTFDPPAPGTETRTMLLWQSDDVTERWIYRQCFQDAGTTLARRKAPTNATIPMGFALEKPTGVQPFRAIFASPLRG